MKKIYKYKKKQPLEQGKFYLFKLNKKVKSPDENEYFVLTDPFCNKHLVPAKYYTLYNLKIGNSYLCKVDKINCLGHIFIEPPHPFYQENKNYLFEFIKTIQENHKSGSVHFYYQFLGENKYEALLFHENNTLPEFLKTGSHFFCIKKISKGKVYIDY